MEPKLSDLSALISATKNNLIKHNYHKYGIWKFESIWVQLSSFLHDRQIDSCEPIHGLDFLHREINYPDILQQPLTGQQRYVIRAIRLLNDYQRNRTISSNLDKRWIVWSDELQALREDLIKRCCENQFSKSTIKDRLFAIDRFLKLVMLEKGISPNQLNAKIISEYIAGLTELPSPLFEFIKMGFLEIASSTR